MSRKRSDERASAGLGRRRTITNQLNIKTRFLAGFAKRGLFGIFIQFDMAAERKPLVQFAMMHQEDLAVLNDEDRNCEIDFLMDVRHGGRTVGRRM